MSRHAPALAVAAVALGIGLAGCIPPEPRPSSTPSTTLTPVFASDEEALQVATETFEKFLEVSNLILNENGADPDRIDEVATVELGASEKEGYREFTANNWTIHGSSVLRETKLQSWFSQPDSVGIVVTIYACVDYTGVDILDSNGQSVVPSDRQSVRGVVVAIAPSDGGYRVATKDALENSATCS